MLQAQKKKYNDKFLKYIHDLLDVKDFDDYLTVVMKIVRDHKQVLSRQ